MSGGVAYLLAMDEPQASTGRWSSSSRWPTGDVETLREMLADHLAETGSTVAQALLADWPPAPPASPR
jgi:glutamate synthase (NADPH/NADH) large chain